MEEGTADIDDLDVVRDDDDREAVVSDFGGDDEATYDGKPS